MNSSLGQISQAALRKSLAAGRQALACGAVIVSGLLISAGSFAADMQSLESIRSAVHALLDQGAQNLEVARYEINVGDLDSRLQLTSCSEPLTSKLLQENRNVGRVTVIVDCVAPKPWTLYVGAEVKAYAKILAATRPIARNEVIGRDDLDVIEQELSQVRGGYYRQAAEVIGKVAKRNINAGHVFTPGMIMAAKLVKRGEDVVIVAETPALNVRMKGMAMSDGVLGERIKVKNLRSKRIVEATVVETGTVRVVL